MVSENEVMRFLKLNVFEKAKLKESNPTYYLELLNASNQMFPVNSFESGEVSDKAGRKVNLDG